jgi:SAM-dependent methyltransferase
MSISHSREQVSSRKIVVQQRAGCAVCGNISPSEVLALPQLPLTGIYVKDHAGDNKYPNIDQALDLCEECGHGQLRYLLDQTYLYEDTYTHRGSESPIAVGVNDFFADWLELLAPGRRFHRIIDAGCGDLYLLKKVAHRGERLLGIDPIWRGNDHIVNEKILVRGQFIQDVDIAHDLGGPPDLIISNHTFEHITDVREQLQRLMAAADEAALFVVEVPSFDSLLATSRFDQVFHQHVNYFTVSSFKRLIAEVGGVYVNHTFNYKYWGGTLLIAFTKEQAASRSAVAVGDVRPTRARVETSVRLFERQLLMARELVDQFSEPFYGYGAAQILPILAYHLDSDLSFLEGIIDDNPRRHGLSYPHLPCVITLPEPGFTLAKSGVFITALDSVRPILRRVTELNARRIVVPLHSF